EQVSKIAVADGFRIVDHVAVVGHSELHKNVPGAGESNATDGSAVKRAHIVQSVNASVFQRVAVCVAFESAITFNLKKLCTTEQSLIRNVLVFSFLDKLGSAT